MLFMPFHVPRLGLRGLITLGTLAAGAYCLYKAFDRGRPAADEIPDGRRDSASPDLCSEGPRLREADDACDAGRRLVAALPWRLGLNRQTGLLLAGLGLVGWTLGWGRSAILSRRRTRGRKPLDGVDCRVVRPDGTDLHVESYGLPDGVPIVFVHGLGSDCDEWFEIRERLIGRHRIIDWDLPGLGESSPPRDGDWSIDRLAGDLDAVLKATCDRPAVLLGHSLGGMILLTFCRLFPETMRQRVAGLVLAHTTYTDPMKTTAHPGLAQALQGPVVEPLCRLTIALSPLVWPLDVLTFLSGEAHRSLEQNLFTGGESREVLDFLAGYFVEDRPSSVAQYCLAMLRYDETATLATITVPTLVVVGDQDDSCTPEAHAFMHAHIAGSQLLTLSPAKHGGLLEHPERFTEAWEEFTAACAARKAPSSSW